jgi:hypothetical protein
MTASAVDFNSITRSVRDQLVGMDITMTSNDESELNRLLASFASKSLVVLSGEELEQIDTISQEHVIDFMFDTKTGDINTDFSAVPAHLLYEAITEKSSLDVSESLDIETECELVPYHSFLDEDNVIEIMTDAYMAISSSIKAYAIQQKSQG